MESLHRKRTGRFVRLVAPPLLQTEAPEPTREQGQHDLQHGEFDDPAKHEQEGGLPLRGYPHRIQVDR